MAEYLNISEVRNYALSTGETADLVALVDMGAPRNWEIPTGPLAVGTVAYVYAMGDMRRGVVVKTTKTKTFVAITTQGAVDQAVRHGGGDGVRVQTVGVPHVCDFIRVAPAPVVEVEQTEAPEAELVPLTVDLEGVTAQLQDEAAEESPELDAERLAELDHQRYLDTQDAERAAAGETPAEAHQRHLDELAQAETLTLHSHDGKVALDSDTDGGEADMTSTDIQTAAPEGQTGSTVVTLLEKVWNRIRENHPELPEVVIITGSGEYAKWGHFRADSWRDGSTKRHELFLASEALAKGSGQVLQTMIHEAAHTLCRVREIKDTSRQGRWHNAEFRKAAEELGLTHPGNKAHPSHGFAFVKLTQATKDRYADLTAELDREIKLTGHLPTWLGGKADEDEDNGGERIAKPKGGEEGGETKVHTGSMKATCECAEPLIIRLSKKVLEMRVVRCDQCESLFTAA